ncbi:MAG TPA: rhomboid family intramembrane serine protease [Arenimonas sp.]|nr:rhomboid family intramembrane serine protease [Arenimonas sp.]
MDTKTQYQQANDAYFHQVKLQFNSAITWILLWLVILGAVFFSQDYLFSTQAFAIQPQKVEGLIGILTAPLLHGSIEHLAGNAFALIILGSIAASFYPRAFIRALPIIWLGSGFGTWFISLGGHHIGASGVTVGIMFFLVAQGIKRRDRTSTTALLIALFMFGGMLLSVLPQEQGVSWEYHFSGAVFGFMTGILFSNLDAKAPVRLYSWDIEDAIEHDSQDTELDLPRPNEVPIIWKHVETKVERKVLPFPRRDN